MTKNLSQKRTARLKVYLSSSEKAIIQAKANKLHLSVSNTQGVPPPMPICLIIPTPRRLFPH